MNVDDDEGTPVKIQFEFLNANEEMELSKEYTVKILFQKNQSEDFETNRIKIINNCDFRTFEERFYYYMFDRTKKIFLTKDTDLRPYININKIIMENCKTFAEQICEKLREETLTYKKKEDTEDKTPGNQSKEQNKTEIRVILRYLPNNFKTDLFAEEFISNNGIQYLDTIIQNNNNNLATYALMGMRELLNFQSAFDYFDTKIEILGTLYGIFMDFENIKAVQYAIDMIVKIVGTSEKKAMYIYDYAEQYSKKTHTKMFSKVAYYLSEIFKDREVKLNTLLFINVLMNYCHPSKLPTILLQLRDVGIFEMIEQMKNHMQKDFELNIKLFLEKSQSVLLDSDYEVQVYKKEIEDMKAHCFEIEKRNASFKEKNEFYEFIIDDFINYINVSDCIAEQAGKTESKKTKEDNPIDKHLKLKVSVDQKGAVKCEQIFKDEIERDFQIISEKYSNLEDEYDKLKKRHRDLGGDGGEIKNEKITELENKLKDETNVHSSVSKIKEELENKIKDLELKISEGGNVVPTAPTSGAIPPPPPPPPGGPGGPPPPPPPPGAPLPPGAPGAFFAPVVKPTKPKIVLKAKVKQLQWQRVLLLPESSPDRPNLIWNNIQETKLDIDEVVSLFGIKKKDQKIEEEKPKIVVKKFLDPKRTQEVSIIITKLPEPEVVNKCLIEFDQSILNSDQVDGLLKILITKEELNLYKSMGEEGNWDKGETYLVKLNQIPNHQVKLKIWSLINKFEEKAPGLSESLEFLVPACNEIKSNKHFGLILSIILGLGNILNGGSIRGQADGFSLDLLSKLPGIKDSFGNSILTWVCSKANKIDSSFEGFKGQFPTLLKASQYSLKETNDSLRELKKVTSQLEQLVKDLYADDTFKKKSLESLEDFKAKVETFDKKNNQNKECYESLVKYYGYKEKDNIFTKNEVFFKMLLEFFKEIDKAMPKLDAKRVISMQNRVVGKKVDQSALMNNLMSQLKQKVQGRKPKN